MSLETVTYITDLDKNHPPQSDDPTESAGHLRAIKKGLEGSFPNFAGAAMTSTEAELNILDGATATKDEINYLDLTTGPGTQEASKAVVADANVNTGVAKVTELHIGASGSEVQVSATPAEINVLDGVTGGTTTADKALVVGSSKELDELTVTTLTATTLKGAPDFMLLEHTETSGTDGGTATSGSWFTLSSIAETTDTGNNITVSSGVITFTNAGTYRIEVDVPFFTTDMSNIRLYDITGTAVLKYGQAVDANSSYGVGGAAKLAHRFTVSATDTARIEARVETTRATTGLGQATGWGAEVYATVRIWKES